VTRKLEAAAHRTSPPVTGLLHTHSRALVRQNENSKAKVMAYFIKRRKVEIEATICNNIKKGVSIARTVEESDRLRRELLQSMSEGRATMAAEKVEFQKKMAELAEIVERQRRVIADHLAGESEEPPAPEVEEAGSGPGEEEEPVD
jgi:hypothetical protein